MTSRIFLSLIAILCLASCATRQAPSPVDPMSAAKAADIKVELVATHSGDGEYISVSPDGGKIAVVDSRVIRILDASTKKVLADTADLGTAFDANSFCWSPDSKRAAFTEDFLRLMRDSDLWVMDIEGGETTRLFADEIKDAIRAKKGNSVIAPLWSPDGRHLFAELFDYSTRSSAIARIESRDKASADILYKDRSRGGASIWSELYINGDYLYFTRDATNKRNDIQDGIYRTDLAGRNTRLILAPDELRGEPFLLGVGADGKYALADHFAYSRSYTTDFLDTAMGEYASGVFLIDLFDFSTRALTRWKSPESQQRVNLAALSRDGSKVVYVVPEQNAGHRLMIQDASGGEGHVLFPLETPSEHVFGTTSLRIRPPIFWTDDDRLFVIGGNGRELYEFKLSLE